MSKRKTACHHEWETVYVKVEDYYYNPVFLGFLHCKNSGCGAVQWQKRGYSESCEFPEGEVRFVSDELVPQKLMQKVRQTLLLDAEV